MEFSAKIITPERTVHDGPVRSLASVNDKGEFSILPNHTNFISIIRDKVAIQHVNKPDEEIPIEKGIVLCTHSGVEIYIGDKSYFG